MAGTYRALADGGYLVETPAGPLRTALSEEQLQMAGLQPLTYGATADDFPDMHGADAPAAVEGGAPQAAQRNVADVPREVPGAGGISYQDWQRARINEQLAPHLPQQRQLTAPEQLRVGANAAALAKQQGRDVGPEEFAKALKTGSGEMFVPRDLKEAQAKAEAVNAPEPVQKPGALRGGARVEDIDLAGQVAEGRAAPPPARFIKTGGKDIRARFDVQKSGIADEEREALQEGLADAEIDTRLGMLQEADREEARAGERARMYQRDVVDVAQEAVRTQRRREQFINTEVAKRQQAIKREREAVDKLEVSPERVYEENGIMFRLAAVISMIAGGALAVRRGGQNEGLAAVNKILDDEMNAQRDNIAKRERGVAGKENELARLTDLYGSPQAAEAELRNRQLAYAEAYAKKFALDSGSQDVQLRVQQTFAERDRARLLERAQLDQTLRDKVTESWAYQPEKVFQVGGQQKPKAIDRMVRVPGGGYGWARDPSSAREVQGKLTVGTDIATTLGKMRKLAADGTLTDLEKRAKYEAYKQDIDSLINVAKGQGAMGVEEAARMTNLTGDPAVILNPQNVTRLDTAIRQQVSRNNGLVRDYLHADPDATTPLAGGRPQSERSE